MLSIRFNATPDTITDVENYFDYEYEEEWFEDSFVREIISDVDKSEVLENCIIDSPVLGKIGPTDISGGAKALILMLKTDEEIWATACGNNCAKWILEIAKKKDITISLEHFMNFGDVEFEYYDIANKKMRTDYFNEIAEIGY